MAKVSIVIPARNERFLTKTVADVLTKAAGEVECVVVLEGWDHATGWAGKDDWAGLTPADWTTLQAKHPNLHTIYHAEPRGMRGAINEAVASAVSRGAKYLLKLDAHCLVDEGYDEKLKAHCEPNWVVVPRRHRLDAENWKIDDGGKPPIDAHYLSFPDDPNDFGGPGLNGKVWMERARERAHIEIDEEMSSQGSGWFMHADYFNELELMDEASYGPFWNEFQELGLKCWLSGGQVMVNKKTWYAHLHKGRKYGRGYHLNESWLKQGRNHTMKWLFNEAWTKQTLPFSTLIERFWPVPTWPEGWESIAYAEHKPRHIGPVKPLVTPIETDPESREFSGWSNVVGGGLCIHVATYGIGVGLGKDIDVTDRVRSLVFNNSLDLLVNNSTLDVGSPFRGKRKTLWVTYSYDGGAPVTVERKEKEWLIVGQVQRDVRPKVALGPIGKIDKVFIDDKQVPVVGGSPLSSTALTDFLIRRFAIPSHRLRGPMPIELPTFHRDDLAALFAELGFQRGAEIGVAEGKYSEVLLKANLDLHLLLVDPWHHYAGNPQGKSKEKDEFAFNETKRRTAQWGPRGEMVAKLSMDAVRDVPEGSLDFCYIDAHHGFDYVMQDLIEWSKRVRSGGIVAGDDLLYLDEKRWGAGPIEAVQAYTKAHRITTWFICNAHRSVDYFWVKL
jgi:glycosyltransferase involved in cell wall biosynthesis